MRALLRSTLALAAIGSIAAGSTAGAQATVNTTATVASAITITPRDLEFGTVFPGVAKSVDFGDNTAGNKVAGRFQIVAEGGSTIALSWTAVPTTLTGPASATLPVSLSGCSTTSATAVGCSANYNFTNGNITLAGSYGSATTHYIFVRGTATPGSTQAAGSYTAPLTVTIAYTGS